MAFSYSALYFSPSAPSTIFDRILGTNGTIYETINGNLYADALLTALVGRIAISQTIFDTNDTNMNGLFETTGNTTFYLQYGTITYSFSGQTIKIGNNYVFPNATYTFNITTGTGNYQALFGQVKITSTDNGSTELRLFNTTLNWRNSRGYAYL
jgi:hypothetical protein